MKVKNVTKKIAAWMMSSAIFITTFNLPGFTTEAKALTTNKPNVISFANVSELQNANNFTLDESNGLGVAKRINFGNGKTWYIAGAQDNQLVLICDPKNPFSTDNVFYQNVSSNQTYSEGNGTYERNVISVSDPIHSNHYGNSEIRKFLLDQYGAGKTDMFSEAEQELMVNTKVYTKDTYRNVRYYTTDKLYLPYGDYGDDMFITVGANDASELNGGIKVRLYSGMTSMVSPYTNKANGAMWLRTPDTYNVRNQALVGNFGNCVDTVLTNEQHLVVPAINLDLTDVLFASSAETLKANANVTDTMTLRFDGTGMISSSVICDDNGIKVTKKDDNLFLYIQYNDGIDKVYSREITGANLSETKIYKGCIGITDLANCKIWLEKKRIDKDSNNNEVDTNLVYAVMAKAGDAGVVGHNFDEHCTCTSCGTTNHNFSIKNTSAKGAFISNATCVEKAKYYMSCACGAVSTSKEYVFEAGEPLNHMWSSYTLDGNQTCTEDGHKTAVCTRAGCSQINRIEATGSKLGHSWGFYMLLGDQTCTEDGHKTAICTRAGCMETNTIVAEGTKLGHVWGEYILDGDQTCTENGHKTARCTRAGCTATNTVEVTGTKGEHVWGEYILDGDQTCTEDGHKTARCTKAGCTATDTIVAEGTKSGHKWSEEFTIDIQATCITPGSKSHHCINTGCDAKKDETDIPVAGEHDFSEYVPNGNGKHKVLCKNCKILEDGHENDDCFGGTATCVVKAICSGCKEEYGTLIEHKMEDVTTKATLTENGKVETKCNGCGMVTNTIVISAPKTFAISKTSYPYTGSQLKPGVVVKDATGKNIASTNYTVTYGTNIAVGKGTIKIVFNGDYSGTKTITFKIVPKKTAIGTPVIASDGITVKWTKNTTTGGYYIYRSVNGKAYTLVKKITNSSTVYWKDTAAKTNGNKYQYKIVSFKTVNGGVYTSADSAVKTIYFISKPAISSLINTAAGKITVKWAKNSKASGYQVQYCSKSNFLGAKIVTVTLKTSTLSKVIANLAKGKTYYVRIKSYKTSGNTRFYSVWSAVKSVKITK